MTSTILVRQMAAMRNVSGVLIWLLRRSRKSPAGVLVCTTLQVRTERSIQGWLCQGDAGLLYGRLRNHSRPLGYLRAPSGILHAQINLT